jgi:hypothetical protein
MFLQKRDSGGPKIRVYKQIQELFAISRLGVAMERAVVVV